MKTNMRKRKAHSVIQHKNSSKSRVVKKKTAQIQRGQKSLTKIQNRRLHRQFDISHTQCLICRRLSHYEKIIKISTTKLNESSKRCQTCLMIFRGIEEFTKSVFSKTRSRFKPCEGDYCAISSSESDGVTVRLTFDSIKLVAEVELFIIESSSPSYLLKSIPNIQPEIPTVNYAVELVNKWIAECTLHSVACYVPPNPTLPTRVLDVGSIELPQVKLLISAGRQAPYVCLSYCWGTDIQRLLLTKANLFNFTKEIPWNYLAKTFKDAILLTRALGLRFLWIDALCILQGDDDLSRRDKEVEIGKMGDVYSNCHLNINATAGPDPKAGLFSPRWTQCKNTRVLFDHERRISTKVIHVLFDEHPTVYVRPRLNLGHRRFIESDNALLHQEDAPSCTRAWILQERLLSARTVYFHAEEIIWDCKSGMNCECKLLKDIEWRKDLGGMTSGFLKTSLAAPYKPDDPPGSIGWDWLDTVTEASCLAITKEEDRIPALSSLAGSLSNNPGKPVSDFFAGIWNEDLARGLLFERVKPRDKKAPIQKSATVRCPPPSWSWTSIIFNFHGKISFRFVLSHGFSQDRFFSAIVTNYTPDAINPFSWASSGIIRAKGRSIEGRLQSSDIPMVKTLKVKISCEGRNCGAFINDGSLRLNREIKLLCIGETNTKLVKGLSLYYALVLQRVQLEVNCWERVGIIRLNTSTRWFSKAPVEEFDIC